MAPIFSAGGSKSVRGHEGGTRQELTFPLEEYPVFLRQGSAIARQELLR